MTPARTMRVPAHEPLASAPMHGDPVRLPGQRALALKRQALASGAQLREGIIDSLRPHAERLDVGMPAPHQQQRAAR
jgi:LDH2 family malate/lactate/ureidoglycolate dehydrogenase